MINSQKGKDILLQTKEYMSIVKVDLDIIKYSNKYNYRIAESPSIGDELKRSDFYKDLDILDFDELFNKHLKEIWLERKRKKEEYLKKLEDK